MSTASVTSPAHQPAEVAVALLWDLDNVAARQDDLPSLAQALTALVPPGAPRIVAAHWRAYKTHRAMLSRQGFRVLCGGNLPDGADSVLLRQARRLHRKHGIGRFVLASNDQDFTRIAIFGDLHVVTLDSERLSLRLRNCASTLTVLARDATGWRTR